ncbi:MAG: ribbon-helix-helix domain-containing protein [Dolichospermum sp.]
MGRKLIGRKFSITVPVDLLKRIEDLAHEENRSLSQQIITLISEALKHRDKTSEIKS